MAAALLQTTLNLPAKRGKVRDVYDLGDSLLIIATDRISAFDCVMPNGIPEKGKILTALSLFWFNHFAGRFANHVLGSDPRAFPAQLRNYESQLNGRAMWVKKTQVIPIECVARGYLAGSGWREYQSSQSVCGIPLPAGLSEGARLPEPIFTPATKEDSGHDLNITFEVACQRIGSELASTLRERTLSIYRQAAEYALSRGVIIADTKFEFGLLPQGELIWIDEALTPDSSRFWPAGAYSPGREQASFDKQYVRDYLDSLNWDKRPPAPALPESVIQGTRQRYVEAYERLTGNAPTRV